MACRHGSLTKCCPGDAGWSAVRLPLPTLLAHPLSSYTHAHTNTHTLSWFSSLSAVPTPRRPFGEALRGLLAAEARGARVLSLTPYARPPPHLPTGSGAVRCELRTPSGAACSVTLAGPSDLLGNQVRLEWAGGLGLQLESVALRAAWCSWQCGTAAQAAPSFSTARGMVTPCAAGWPQRLGFTPDALSRPCFVPPGFSLACLPCRSSCSTRCGRP